MAGARALWRATGMKDSDFGKPIIAVVNSFTQFVPGHVHLKDLGQLVAEEIAKAGGAVVLLDKEHPSQLAPEGEPGELAVHGPQVMRGYWNRPETDAETFVEIAGKRYLRTGDVARIGLLRFSCTPDKRLADDLVHG